MNKKEILPVAVTTGEEKTLGEKKESEHSTVSGQKELLEWLCGKVADAKFALKYREDTATLFSGGSDASWAAAAELHPSTAGKLMDKAARLREANSHSRIAEKCRHELQMYESALAALEFLARCVSLQSEATARLQSSLNALQMLRENQRQTNFELLQLLKACSDDLAERTAGDCDFHGIDARKWWKAVKKARNFLACHEASVSLAEADRLELETFRKISAHRERIGLKTEDAKWLDPACFVGCQSILYKRQAKDAEARAQEAERQRMQLIEDWCEDDTTIRNLLRPILGELKTDGDSYGVPTPVDLVESLCVRLAEAERKLKEK